METRQGKGKGQIIGGAVVALLIFSLFRRAENLIPVGGWMADQGSSMISILVVWTLIGTLFTGFAVLLLLPRILDFKAPRQWMPRFFRANVKAVVLGILSFVVFGLLATVISLSMGIFIGDWSVVLARPDIRPEPDVIGWGYFILALIPGIWEELGFRGLIQSRLREGFSDTASVLLSAIFFSLFHITNLLTETPGTTIGGVIMAFFFGLAWGSMTVRARSILPAVISHYLVDSVGSVFLNVDGSNPGLVMGFFLLLTIAFPLINIPLTMLLYRTGNRDKSQQQREEIHTGAIAIGS